MFYFHIVQISRIKVKFILSCLPSEDDLFYSSYFLLAFSFLFEFITFTLYSTLLSLFQFALTLFLASFLYFLFFLIFLFFKSLFFLDSSFYISFHFFYFLFYFFMRIILVWSYLYEADEDSLYRNIHFYIKNFHLLHFYKNISTPIIKITKQHWQLYIFYKTKLPMW